MINERALGRMAALKARGTVYSPGEARALIVGLNLDKFCLRR